MNGYIDLHAFGGRKYIVLGGPYYKIPEGAYGICLLENYRAHCDVKVRWPDFGVPDTSQLIAGLDAALDLIIAKKPVYVGCGAGIGRTGTFLACLAKLFGEEDPISYVRTWYLPAAIETRKQEELIDSLQFPWRLRMKAVWARIQGWNPIKGDILTELDDVQANIPLRRCI